MKRRISVTSAVKHGALSAISLLTGRRAVLLPRDARAGALLPLRAPYRVDGRVLRIHIDAPVHGTLSAQLLGYLGHFPRARIGRPIRVEYPGPSEFVFLVDSAEVQFNERTIATIDGFGRPRRFCWAFELESDAGRTARMTSHYVTEAPNHGEAYYSGSNYVAYEAESAGDHEDVAGLLTQFGARGTVLEVGCATGGLLAALDKHGYRSYGVDISEWAVARARERLGPGRVWVCDLGRDALPECVAARGPFNAIVMAAVLEHFGDPFGVVAKLTQTAAPGAILVVTTTNASSLAHWLFGEDWEGYFDASHHGVDAIDVAAFRRELPRIGWRVLQLHTHLLWTRSADPLHATMRDWYVADARFRELVRDGDLGDLVTCVAVRQ